MREKIIACLKEATGYLSGEEISRQLDISRAGIWKYIEVLRKAGYKIQAVPRWGYKLVAAPDKMLSWEIQSGLGTKIFGKKLLCHEAIDSTMDEAFRLAKDGAVEGTVVCAESQAKGRGRMGRCWVSPKGKGVYFSLILRPTLPLNEVAKLTLLAAVATGEALRKVTGQDVRIKWPNDLLLNGKKVAGILTELNAEVDRVNFVILGIGVNVNTAERQLPEGAVSLRLAAKKEFSRVTLMQAILRELEADYVSLGQKGFIQIFNRWRELSATLGRRVVLSDYGKELEGTAVDLADDGGLLIRDNSGKVIKKMTGDVVVLKG